MGLQKVKSYLSLKIIFLSTISNISSPKAPLFDLIGHEDKVLCCDWSNHKYMMSGGSDNSLRIFKSNKTGVNQQKMDEN